MNYIVMDLEWNQSAKGKQFSEDHFPFEIIQIGAAKVNEKLDIVDEWQCTIKPQVYTKLQNTVKKILGITENDLANGTDFVSGVTEFLEWWPDRKVRYLLNIFTKYSASVAEWT